MHWPGRGDAGTPVLRIVLLALIHAILLYNALRHDPRVGYDAEEHFKYIEVLSGFRLPTAEQTYESYVPPLPYVAPALARALGAGLIQAARVGQVVNVLASLFLMHHLLRIAEMLRPRHEGLKLLALGLLGTLPVYYKTFSFVRGEPMLAAMAVAAAHEAIAIFVRGERSRRRAAALGIWLGLALLSRQMAFLLLPALGLLLLARLVGSPGMRRFLLARAVLAGVVALFVCGGFYAHLAARPGGMTAARASLSNNPVSFYADPGLEKLFTDPVRDAFPNRLFPLFYSEVWGDYWCYFLVRGHDARNGRPLSGLAMNRALSESPPPSWLRTNRESMGRYLGRVNLMALPASGVLIGGFVAALAGGVRTAWRRRAEARASAARRPSLPGAGDSSGATRSFLFLVTASTLAGYFWFLIAYPSPSVGRSIKASYVLQVFPFACLLGAESVVRLADRAPRTARWLCILLAAGAVHNLPALFTRALAR